MEALCKTIVAVTNIKGKKFDIFHKRKRLNLFFFGIWTRLWIAAYKDLYSFGLLEGFHLLT